MKNLLFKSIATAVCLLAASSSYASLVLVAPEDFGGTGLGTVKTILTIQDSPRANPPGTEAGSVSYNGSVDVLTGDAKTGASQSLTRTVAELGLTSASAVRVVFNAVEPGNDANSISLDDLVLTFYGAAGETLFSSGAFDPVFFANTSNGTGNSGFVFALDAAQAAAAQAAVFNLASFGSVRVGLSASASLAGGGNETFFIANSANDDGGSPPAAVPEPTTVALLGLGLVGFVASRRKSATSKNAE